MLIRTANLLLRPVFPEDAGEVYVALNDEATVRMLARVPWPYTLEASRQFCDRVFDPLGLRFAIALPGSRGAPIIGMVGIDAKDDDCELGYWIAVGQRGQGYATEAVEAALDAAAILGYKAVTAGHYLENVASGAVLRKCGFVPTGEVRSVACAGRGGALVPSRRYICDITARAWVREAA